MEIHVVLSLSDGCLEAIYAYQTARLARAKLVELTRRADATVEWMELSEDLFRSTDARSEIHLLTLPLHIENSM